MKGFIAILVLATLAVKLTAGVTPIRLTIQPSPAGAVTVTANGVSQTFPNVVLLESTNLTQPNWVALRTNIFGGAGPVVFTNVQVTASNQFFRVWTY
jgi:hypothetical protein